MEVQRETVNAGLFFEWDTGRRDIFGAVAGSMSKYMSDKKYDCIPKRMAEHDRETYCSTENIPPRLEQVLLELRVS